MKMATTLLMGAAKVDITPEKPVELAGFGWRNGVFTDVASRLYARIFAFSQTDEAGKQRKALLVSTDLICWGEERMPGLLQALNDRWGFDERSVILNATHTHSGPQTSSLLLPCIGSSDPVYLEWLEARIIEGAGIALTRLRPVRAERGKGSCGFNINRRSMVDGRITGLPNEDGPVDRDVTVVRFTAPETGETAGVFVHYACHPTTTDSTAVSAEFPGAAMERLEREFGGQAVCAYWQGCCGDVRPALIRDGQFYRGGPDEVNRLGEELAAEALSVLGRPMTPLRPSGIAFDSVEVPLLLRQLPAIAELESKQGLTDPIGEWSRLLLTRQELIRQEVPLHVNAVKLAEGLTMLAMNGEVVSEYGLEWKRQYGDGLMAVPYSNGMLGYIPNARQVAEGGYEGRDSYIYFGLPAPPDESLEARIKAAVKELLGNLGKG